VSPATETDLFGWDRLRHGGLLLDPGRLRAISDRRPKPLSSHLEQELRRQGAQVQDGTLKAGEFAAFVLQEVCGFTAGIGTWQRGPAVGAEWGRQGVAGESIKPRQLWRGDFGAVLPVFIDTESRLGIGRGTRAASQVLQWLRAGTERLAILTNGRQWRLVFAGLDFDAWCQWDVDLWFEEGALAPQVAALRTLLQPTLWTPERRDATPALLQAILDSRKGQSELSAVLGERVREAVELLIQAHGDVLKRDCGDVEPSDIYRAAVRIVMRLVVILFAESREKLLPRENALYHGAYGLTGLREELDKVAHRTGSRLKRSTNAWPRILALFRLIFEGSHHPDLPIPEYGGELFQPADASSKDGLVRALAVFETACFEHDLMFPDSDVHRMLELLTRTKVRIRQGKASTWVPVPIDFSDLSSEYIGILYEGLLDFELKTAPSGDPVIFLAVGNQPALPLSQLEAMDDKALVELFERLKDTNSEADVLVEDDQAGGISDDEAHAVQDEDDETEGPESPAPDETPIDDNDERLITRTRAEEWARRAVAVGKLVTKPKGTLTAQKKREWGAKVAKKATEIVTRVILPGEWYLVRWGGTRKGRGTFYTRPGLAVPTVHRTLRPLAYVPPPGVDGAPDFDAPATTWTPRTPEEILALKVCDPACGSGTFPVAALRFLTDTLYASLHHHGRISEHGDRAIVRLLDRGARPEVEDLLGIERLACRPSDETFEPRLKAVLRRYVVERSIYGVDIDPLAVELCRLALWIETMDRDLPFSFLDHKIKCGNSLVGAWFDTFQHYPVMAWKNREGGDNGHTNGVHFQEEARTKAIKAFVKDTLTPNLQTFIRVSLHENPQLFEAQRAGAEATHAHVMAVLSRLHDLPVHAASDRARAYRDEVVGSSEYQALRRSLNLWSACWFWPVNDIMQAPLPTTLSAPSPETVEATDRLSLRNRFFHWELEFPDVFNAQRSGFDAILGNPPWDIAKPNSKEFFSNIDPLYRSYGKLEAITRQEDYFADPEVEERWLDYNGDFRAQSNFVAYAAYPFGDPTVVEKPEDRFTILKGKGGKKKNADAHDRWREARATGPGFADRAHPYRHQGSADLNLYKLFLEQTHTLLRPGGRLGFVVPSGLYSDLGTGDLRRLLLDQCRWEWLFGFENREKVFDIDSRFKFNPVIIEKGGETRVIRTAFMRRRLEDWESGETLATAYTREQVERFSPRSKAILEIQSRGDLEILEKIYANSVLLGDNDPGGWGTSYATEFHMTNDSRLFPPRSTWEANGYRPDEYSRWIKGDWRPIGELWRELDIDPARVVPIDAECEHRIAAPDVQRTRWRVRCAQPPYDALPIPRADIPLGIILSREGDAWLDQSAIDEIALPVYEGRMIGQYDFSEKGWVSGSGRGARWDEVPWSRKEIRPQYLMSSRTYQEEIVDRHLKGLKKVAGEDAMDHEARRLSDPAAFREWWRSRSYRVSFMDVTSATNARTLIAAACPLMPSGNKVPLLMTEGDNFLGLLLLLNSFPFDFVMRRRLIGLSVNYFIIAEAPLPLRSALPDDLLGHLVRPLATPNQVFGDLQPSAEPTWGPRPWKSEWSLTSADRLRRRCMADAVAAAFFGLSADDLRFILFDCDRTADDQQADAKGFWRIDREKDPELRQTILTLVAFSDLEMKIAQANGDARLGVQAFVAQNDGAGWMLPDSVRLADYGLGHNERAKHPQPVARRCGPRFLDWQLAQTADESRREKHVHLSNLIANDAHALMDRSSPREHPRIVASAAGNHGTGRLFD